MPACALPSRQVAMGPFLVDNLVLHQQAMKMFFVACWALLATEARQALPNLMKTTSDGGGKPAVATLVILETVQMAMYSCQT